MRGEGESCDLKVSFDPNDSRARIELVKDLVSLANAGGGQVKFGYTETETPGVPRDLLPILDGARLMDLVNRYVAPGTVRIAHAVESLGDDRVGIVITVSPCGKYPLVFSQDGNYRDGPSPVFRKGDIYTRHGARSERANYQDIMNYVDAAVEASRGELMRKIEQLARLPDGYVIKFAPPTGEELDEPNNLLATVAARRTQDASVLLTGRDLLWCWVNRDQITLDDTNADLLVRSALRRTPTLFLWLTQIMDRPTLITRVLITTLEDPDRDKSDAAKALLETGAFVAGDADLDALVEGLRTSRYAHFQEAVRDWNGRESFVAQVLDRVRVSRWEGHLLVEMTNEELLRLSRQLASELLRLGRSVRHSRVLTDIGRMVFLRALGRFQAQ